MIKAIACVILLIGLLKFAQEAPDLLKKIFSAGGDLLGGIDLNPRNGMKDLAQTTGRIGSAVAGAAGGLTGGLARGIQNAGADWNAVGGKKGFFGGLHAVGAGLGGGIRGMVRGGVNGARNASDSPSPHNMFNQLMSGVDQGQTSASRASQRFREGDSTVGIVRVGRRAVHGISNFGHDHIVEPFGDYAGALSSGRNSSEIAGLNDRMKANNDAVLNATGGKKNDDTLKAARDAALAKVREGQTAGADINHVLNDLGIDPATFNPTDNNGNPLTGAARWAALRDRINDNYRDQRNDMLRERYNGTGNDRLSDQRMRVIQQYNDETIRDFERNAALLSQDSLRDLLNRMNGQNILDNNGNAVQFTVDANDLNGSLRDLVAGLNRMNDEGNIRANGVDLMNNLTRMQGQMDKIGSDIQNDRTLREHTHSNHGGNNNNNSGSGSSGSGGNS